MIENCVFWGNTGGEGGAIFSQGASPEIIGCLIYGNTAQGGGGGVSASQGTCTIINSTITANASIYPGGGGGPGPSLAIVRNSIIWGNTSPNSTDEEAQIDLRFGASVAITNSCVQGLQTWLSDGNTGYDPLFVSPASGNYHLQDCSPLLDAGDNSAVAGIGLDLDGNPRIAGPPWTSASSRIQMPRIRPCISARSRFHLPIAR